MRIFYTLIGLAFFSFIGSFAHQGNARAMFTKHPPKPIEILTSKHRYRIVGSHLSSAISYAQPPKGIGQKRPQATNLKKRPFEVIRFSISLKGVQNSMIVLYADHLFPTKKPYSQLNYLQLWQSVTPKELIEPSNGRAGKDRLFNIYETMEEKSKRWPYEIRPKNPICDKHARGVYIAAMKKTGVYFMAHTKGRFLQNIIGQCAIAKNAVLSSCHFQGYIGKDKDLAFAWTGKRALYGKDTHKTRQALAKLLDQIEQDLKVSLKQSKR